MTHLEAGDEAPEFTLPADGGSEVTLSDLRGRTVILYFYPRDDTPGCTKEAKSFRDGLDDVEARNAIVLGVSTDDVASHQAFKEKYDLNFPLLADTEKDVVEAYGVWGTKKMFGKEFEGTFRTTFVIDEEGVIDRVYERVDPEGHCAAILKDLA